MGQYINIKLKEFDWTGELHKTMVHSLTTSFGLDFLLFEDKKGGNVDTIRKVRDYQQDLQKNGASDIHVSEEIINSLTLSGKNKEEYNSRSYHSDTRYINKGRQDKLNQESGQLDDPYRNKKMDKNEKRQLDHIQSASEIHHDAGRILSGLNGVDLANDNSNFSSTLEYINNRKSNMPIQEFIEKIPSEKKKKQESIHKIKEKIANMPENTPKERHEKQKKQDELRKQEEHLKALESIDTDAMLEADKKARAVYNQKINFHYYTNSKFFHSLGKDMGTQGVKMGARQAFGLLLAEVWFERKEQIPLIYRECCKNFQLSNFIKQIGTTLNNIWERVKLRFKDMLALFKDGFLSGIISSLTTTIWNAFQTIGGNTIKIIRETWNSIIQAIKLVFFNPSNLSLGELTKELIRIIGTAAAISVGTIVNSLISELLKFIPFDFIRGGLAAFISALVSGILTIGLCYFLDHSETMQKVWNFLDKLKDKHKKTLEYFQQVNNELDRYLTEFSKIEFNMNPLELQKFSDALFLTNNEIHRSLVLNAEISRRHINLPFETGNTNSVRDWLKTL